MLAVDSLSLSLLQIESLIYSAGKKTHKGNFNEANQLVESHKKDAELHFIRCLFSAVDFSPYEPKTGQKDIHQAQHLSHEFNSILSKPNFPSLLCYAIDKPLPSSKGFGPSRQLLPQIARLLKLNRVQEVVLGLALSKSSNAQLVYYAQQWIRQKLSELIRSHVAEIESSDPVASTGTNKSDGATTEPHKSANPTAVTRSTAGSGVLLHDVSIEVLHYLISHILDDADHFGIADQLVQSLLSGLRREFPRSRMPVSLSALLHPDILELSPPRALCPNTSLTVFVSTATSNSASLHGCGGVPLDDQSIHGAMTLDTTADPTGCLGPCLPNDALPDPTLVADLLEELGPACTRSLETMRLTLAEFGQHELTPTVVAKCICLFMRMAEVKPSDEDDSNDTGDSEPHPSTAADSCRSGMRRASHHTDPINLDAQMILRAGSSGALWREVGVAGSVTGTGTGTRFARPSSLFIPNSFCDHLASSSLSASEPRLNQLDSGTTQLSFNSHPTQSCNKMIKWNVENFLTVVDELNPKLDMDQVLVELDCPEFFVTSRAAFAILKLVLFHGNRSSGLEVLFYRPWNNVHGQFSLLRHCYIYPDVISLAYYQFRCVDLSLYRLSQSEDQAIMQIWKNIDYVQTLLTLSERGVFSEVQALLEQALILCPSIMTATLLETNPCCVLRSTILRHAFVHFLSPRPNSQVVLQSAWNGTSTNQLKPADLRTQRHLLLTSILEYVAQLTVLCVLEPTTLPELIATGPTGTNNLTRLVELLASVTDSNPNVGDALGKGSTILTILLGTTEAPSAAVPSLLLSPTTASAGTTNYSTPLPANLLPTPVQAIDLALVLLIRIANGVSRVTARSGADASAFNPTAVATVQTAIKLFLPQWFTEYMRDKELAEPFAYGIVDYLRLRYTSYVLGSTVPASTVNSASSMSALPADLRKPSSALLNHIIRSAQDALKSPSCSVRDTVVTEVNQALNLFLQNLLHTVSLTSKNLSALAGSNSISQTGNRITASSAASAFGVTMKPGAGPQAPQSGQSQNRNPIQSTGLATGNAALQPHYQPANLATAAALAAASNFSNNPDDFSRCTAINALTSRLSQTNLSQHQGSSLQIQQRKVSQPAQATGLSEGMRTLLGGTASTPVDHAPVALSFASEPLEIEMNKEAEAEANAFFQKLLKGISTPDEMFRTVCEYATQGTVAQRRSLDGILRMLADEVSQFLQDYPEPMLPLIADLYGSILAASTHLLSIRALSMLWRAVLARLYLLPPDTSMELPLFRAVVMILIKAKNTFTQFFNLPNYLVGCPVFKLFPHDLQEHLLNAEMIAKNYIMSHQSSTGSKSAQLHGPHQTLSGSTPGSSTQLSSMTFATGPPPQTDLMQKTPESPEPPEEAVSDRIYFLFNNVSKTNVKEKSAELAELLSDERIQPWFASYLVGKRVPVENTFHDLFALVLDHIQDKAPNVRPKIMQELIRNIKLLLRNIRQDRDDMQARSTLKNLGSFLGLITLARNKPLLHDDLNVKDLIYEAYHKGPTPTQFVVPFVARVVRGATESIVFRPPNPWTMAILKVFRELYDMRDVKDCLRFEIEILYRAFKLNLDEVQLAYFLRDPNHFANLEVHLCFLVNGSTVTTSASLETTTISMANAVSGSEPSGTTHATSLTNITDLVPATNNLTSHQQMLNVFAALQKQQQQQIPCSQNTNLDLANLMQSSLASSVGGTANRSHASQALALAAVMASGQAQKQVTQTSQPPQTQQQPFVSGSTGTGGTTVGSQSLSFTQQQKQLAAAVAALQQTQWHTRQQQQLPSSSATSQFSVNSGPSNQQFPDSANEVPLCYEDVSARTIRSCLNLDETIAAAANRTGSPGNNAAAAAIALLQANPHLRGLIEPAVTRAINELTTPVFERCARITVTTVAAIVRKDFALDPNPNRMLFAARHMVRHLAAGMSLTTAREALGMSLVTTLKNIILAEVQSASAQEKEAVPRLAHSLVAEAMHACLAFMQKSVAEKAVADVEQKLEPDVKLRTELGPRRFLEQATSQLSAQQNKIPEQLRLKVGGPTRTEMAVYEEFGRVIPGFAPSTTSSSSATQPPINPASMLQPSSPNAAVAMAAYFQQQQQQQQDFGRLQRQVSATSTGSANMILRPLMSQSQMTQVAAQSHQLMLQQQQQQQQQSQQISQTPITGLFDKIIGQIERHLTAISTRLRSTTDPMIRSLRCLIDAVHLAKTNRDVNVAMNVISTMVQSFLEHYRPGCWRNQPHGLETMEHLKEAHMLTLRHMLSSDQAPFGCAWVTSQVTQTWIRLDSSSSSSPSGDRQSQTSSGSLVTDAIAEDAGKSEMENKTSNEPTRDQTQSAWSSGWKPQSDGTSNEPSHTDQSKLGSIKWNWEAFAELLKVHVVYLSQVDAYLAKEVAAGHPGAISFVIDLLDHFVLPCPSGTAVGAAAAAAAAAAANFVRPGSASMLNGSQANASASTTSGSRGSVSTVNPSSKREFTVLNEYDLWSTLEAMRARVSTLNAALSASTSGSGSTVSGGASGRSNAASLTDPLALRLRLACARARGLLDLGLLEQSPLFVTPPGCPHPPISALYAGCSQAREFDDPPTLQEKVERLMRNWVEIYQSPRQRDSNTIDAFLAQLVQIGVLANMDILTRFLRLATIFVVERALKQLKLQDQQQQHSLQMPPVGSTGMPLGSGLNSGMSVTRVAAYIELDAYARLISIVIKRGGVPSEQPHFKVLLLNKVLGIIAGVLLQEHEVRRDWFYSMPFERILIMLFVELHPPATMSELGVLPGDGIVGDAANIPSESGGTDGSKSAVSSDKAQIAESRNLLGRNLKLQQQLPLIFCHVLHCLRPERASAFVFAWLEMLAHRWFVGRILSAPGPPELRSAYQAMYAQLLVDLLKFLGYFLQNAVMMKPIQGLYKATLRLFLVLIHDFPEFVSDYYALFCDVVPSNSIQLRNLILSALPKRGMPSADPVQAPPVDHLASLEDPTGYCMEAGSRLPEPMRRELDAFLASRAPVKLLSELVTMLRRADDVLPPFPPPQYAHHPQQQARHQQALAAYAAALAANDASSLPSLAVSPGASNLKNSDKTAGDDSTTSTTGSQTKKSVTGKHSGESTADSGEATAVTSGATEDSLVTSARSASSPSLGSSSAAAAALQWGVRATQQLATFGLADGMHYNVELMNNLTLYLCITAIRSLREKGMPLNMSTIAHTPQMDIIQSLVLNLDNEGRYLLLNCMANQLRYPNSHTYYFSYTILYLFSEQSKEQVKEQISRVLLERLIVNRPHPWGLLMTGAELLRNPAYRFWEHEFARCHPEIEHIVTVVARSCIPNFQLPAINPSGGPNMASSSVLPGLRNALSSSVPHGRRQASPLTRGAANVGGTVHAPNLPTPLLTE